MRIPEWFEDIRVAFSMKSDGQMSLKRADRSHVTSNRRRFLQSYGLELEDVVAGELVHEAKVRKVTSSNRGQGAVDFDWIRGIDGMVTDDPALLMLTTHADCAPILIFDANHRVLAQAHAGWRSLRKGIVESLVQTVRSYNGTSPVALKAWIGPTIRACCYPVGIEVAGQFPEECRILVGDTIALDLTRFIRMEFARLEFAPGSITDSGICTSCDPAFASFRRDGNQTVAMALVSGL